MAQRHPKRIIIVIKAAILNAANTEAAKVDRVGGGQTFSVGLSASGAAPATHYWCSWKLTDGWDSSIRNKLATAISNGNAWAYNGQTTTPEQVLTELGLQRIAPA